MLTKYEYLNMIDYRKDQLKVIEEQLYCIRNLQRSINDEIGHFERCLDSIELAEETKPFEGKVYPIDPICPETAIHREWCEHCNFKMS